MLSQTATLAALRALTTEESSNADSIPVILITTSSSTRVKLSFKTI